MSVLRHGGTFLHRSLSKLYSDTKQSYESVTKASRINDDPELIVLHREFRTQKDRLLAWGLEWSDSSKAPPHDVDIDEPLSRAGLSEVVGTVMSKIQGLLSEAEKMQKPQNNALSPAFEKRPTESYSPGGHLQKSQVKTAWTDDEILRLHALLAELTSCIDTLCELSHSRKSLTSSSRMAKSSKESPILRSENLKVDISESVPSHRPGFDFGNPTSPQNEDVQRFLIQSNAAIHPLYLDRNALDLTSGEVTHALNPPPYEVIAASYSTRLVGSLKSSAVSPEFLVTADLENGERIPVLVEFTPVLSWKSAAILPPHKRLESVAKTLLELISRARTSHTAFLSFLGYFIDLACSQYAFVYRLPLDSNYAIPRPFGSPAISPKTLLSILPSDDGMIDSPIPALEDRFRLAYNLIIAVLQLQEQNLIHGNVNSSNVIFMKAKVESSNRREKQVEDIRDPYLTSFAKLSDDGMRPNPEPLSASVYRHPNDRRFLEDKSAWTYDLYSLGLVLLEIGLWTPLNRLWKSKYNQAIFKSRIENVYAKKLASKCGSAFMNVVKKCLAAPDSQKSLMVQPAIQSSRNSVTSFHVARRYVYSIAKDVSRCCAIDIFGPSTQSDLDTFAATDDPLPEEPNAKSTESRPLESELSKNATGSEKTTSVLPTSVSTPEEARTSPTPEPPKRHRPVLKKWNHLELPQKCLDDWNTALMPRLSKLLQKILKDSPESCSASLMMVGERPEAAKPTICVTCASVGKVRGALKRYFDYERDLWGLVVIRGDVTRSKVPRKKKRRAKKLKAEASPIQNDLNPHYQLKPSCGASIGAFRDGEHYPPVSYGGIVMVDSQPFGMTVHHMLDAPSEDEETEADDDCDVAQRCAAQWNESSTACPEDVAYTWSWDTAPELPQTLEISDDEDEDSSLFNSSFQEDIDFEDDDDLGNDYDEEDAASVGDIAGVDPEQNEELIVTQPALDDVEDGFYPNLEDRDEEHLCFTLGSVFASSGIRRRRCSRSGLKHEIDWALIKMNEDRLEPHNSLLEGTTFDVGKLGNPTPMKIAKTEDLSGLDVVCRGRTSGLRRGKISKAMMLVKMHDRHSFSNSWCVDGGFGIPGDSGAWIFDAKNRQLCGHILAWSPQSQTAFIAPMQVLVDDIRETLDAESVVLPDSEEGEECVLRLKKGGNNNHPSAMQETDTQVESSSASAASPAAAGLSIDLRRLSFGADSLKSRTNSIPKDVPSTFSRRPSLMRQSPSRGVQMV